MKNCLYLIKHTNSFATLLFIIVLSILRTVRDLACLVALTFAMNQLIIGGDITTSIVFIGLAELSGIPILAAYGYTTGKYKALCEKQLMVDLANKAQTANPKCLYKMHVSEYISTTTSDLTFYLNWLVYTVPNAIRECIYFIGGIIFAISHNVLLTVSVFPIVLFTFPIIMKLSEPIKRMTAQQRKIIADSQISAQEVLSNSEIVKAYSMETYVLNKMEGVFEEQRRAEKKIETYTAVMNGLGKFGSILPGLIALVIGLLFLQNGSITAGFLFGFVQMITQRIGRTILQFVTIIGETDRASIVATRLIDILRIPNDDNVKCLVPTDDYEPLFSLQNVNFLYPTGRQVLFDISMHINKGETVAIVGRSGSGKSTLLKILMGILQPTNGRVECKGIDISDWNISAFRAMIAPIFQETFLFPMSLRENLQVNGFIESEHNLMKALRKSGLADYVNELPMGLETEINQRGASISGGQKQRIAIARAWIKQTASIIIMDEPTSALDSITEQVLQQTLTELGVGKTTIVVTHKLRSIQNVDKIYMIMHGRIVQTGTHAQLMAVDGDYRDMYKMNKEECT